MPLPYITPQDYMNQMRLAAFNPRALGSGVPGQQGTPAQLQTQLQTQPITSPDQPGTFNSFYNFLYPDGGNASAPTSPPGQNAYDGSYMGAIGERPLPPGVSPKNQDMLGRMQSKLGLAGLQGPPGLAGLISSLASGKQPSAGKVAASLAAGIPGLLGMGGFAAPVGALGTLLNMLQHQGLIGPNRRGDVGLLDPHSPQDTGSISSALAGSMGRTDPASASPGESMGGTDPASASPGGSSPSGASSFGGGAPGQTGPSDPSGSPDISGSPYDGTDPAGGTPAAGMTGTAPVGMSDTPAGPNASQSQDRAADNLADIAAAAISVPGTIDVTLNPDDTISLPDIDPNDTQSYYGSYAGSTDPGGDKSGEKGGGPEVGGGDGGAGGSDAGGNDAGSGGGGVGGNSGDYAGVGDMGGSHGGHVKFYRRGGPVNSREEIESLLEQLLTHQPSAGLAQLRQLAAIRHALAGVGPLL